MESSLYMILHLMAGFLPWSHLVQNQTLDPEERNEKILQMKVDFLESDF